MSDEEMVSTILDIDVLLLEMESALQTNNHIVAQRKIRQARSIIADIKDYDDDTEYHVMNKAK